MAGTPTISVWWVLGLKNQCPNRFGYIYNVTSTWNGVILGRKRCKMHLSVWIFDLNSLQVVSGDQSKRGLAVERHGN